MCAATPSHPDLDVLLRGFLAGNRAAREQLPRVADRYVRKIARRLASDLPEDIQEEVVNQAFENLVRQKPSAYRPGRGSPGTFLKFMVRAAARQVRASYTPPGQVTRVRRRKTGVATTAVRAVLCLDELNETDLPSTQDALAAVEAKHDVEALLRLATRTAARALRQVYLDERPMESAAADAGVTRFKMSRQIRESLEKLKAAA